MKKKIAERVAKLSRFEVQAGAAEQQWLHNDSRVILRRRDVAQFELSATEEHLNALRASTVEVAAQKERLEAKIAGMTRVLQRR